MATNKTTIQLTTKTFILMVLFCYLPLLDIGFCQWSTDPSENNVLAWGLYVPVLIPDMQNGVIVAGQTHWAGPIIYAQRMSVDGRRLWPGYSGVKITDSPYMQWIVDEGSREPEFGMSDGAGGCYIGYQIARLAGYTTGPDPTEFYDVGLYIQRLDSNSNRLFGPRGLALMPDEKDGTGYHQQMQYWCADGHGGLYAIFARAAYEFEPERDGIYLARISASGQILWGPKRMSRSFVEYLPYLDSELNLNLYQFRSIHDKFLKVDPETAEIISEKDIRIGARGSDLSGSYDYCFSDSFSIISAFEITQWDTLRMQKLDENGNKLWGDEPVIIDQGDQYLYLRFDVESDQRGGAYILYSIPLENIPNNEDTVHLVHLDKQGRRLWHQAFYSHMGVYGHGNEMMAIGSDGSVFVLTDHIKYVTKFSFEGEILWQTMVTSRDTIAYSSWYSGLMADSLGGCIVVWHEIGAEFCGFMAQRVDKNGNLGGPTSVWSYSSQSISNNNEITSVYPNPFNDAVTISFSVQHSQQTNLKVFNILGKEVVTLKAGKITGGDHVINWRGTDGNGQSLASGVYLLVLQTGSTRVSQKLLILR